MSTFFKRSALAVAVGLTPLSMASAQVTATPPPLERGAVQAAPGLSSISVLPGNLGNPGREHELAVHHDRATIQRLNVEANREAGLEESLELNREGNRAVASDWRMQNFRNRWWYYHPNRTWSYYQGGRWVPYRPMTNQPAVANGTALDANRPYSAGYRGTPQVPIGVKTMRNPAASPSLAPINPAPINPASGTSAPASARPVAGP
ncbi:MAG TPA: hypothetical protein VMF30_16515 [Pirellulales bacterium]|nr:hypothetical protein [Pirellulales bacterium]